MSNAESFECLSGGCSEAYKTIERPAKGGREMVLDLGVKPEIFVSDETPTPIRLIRNCEEMGLFQDLQNVNPFEETFRKATEDIRSGSSKLEVSSLCVPNNDDSLHTPHVVYPPIGEPSKSHSDRAPPVDLLTIQSDTDPLCLSLDTEEPNKTVVQQEADTSQEMLSSDSDVADEEDYAPQGTIQFLLRMPNGKMVQLSSLPVEHVDYAQTGLKDVPIIKVDSAALKDKKGSTEACVSDVISTATQQNENSVCSSGSMVVNVGRESVVSLHQNSIVKESCQKAVKSSLRDNIAQSSKMSLAKQRLKQALMTNSCPAATPSTSSSTVSDSNLTFSSSKLVPLRRPSSTSDEGSTRASDNSSIEEKRRRNRAAAMRCREKRKTWVQELERRASDMLRTNSQLQCEVSLLRDEVAQLKTLLLAHRDCPVTQALVQGPAVIPIDRASSPPKVTKRPNKDQMSEASSQALLVQTPSTAVKPVIVLGDPPVKRKRLQPSSKNVSSIGPVVTTSTVPQTFVISSMSNVSTKTATLLNSNFVNVFPSVLVANPTSSSGTTTNSHQVITLSSVVPTISSLSSVVPTMPSLPAKHFGCAQRQPFILPKADSDSSGITKQSKVRTSHILSTNVIKVNPNARDRDSESYDSDVEVIDVDINSDFS